MGGGPVAPHIQGCPFDIYEVCEPQTTFAPHVPSTNAAKEGCSKQCAKARGEDINEVEEQAEKGSIVSDIPYDSHPWIRALAMAYSSEQQNQRQKLQEIGKPHSFRCNQLDVGSIPREMPQNKYNWIRAMEVYHSSEQPNFVVIEDGQVVEYEQIYENKSDIDQFSNLIF